MWQSRETSVLSFFNLFWAAAGFIQHDTLYCTSMSINIIYKSPTFEHATISSTYAPKSRRSPLKRALISQSLTLTSRHIALLEALSSFGVLTTVQIAMLFFHPDIKRRLALYGLSEPKIAILQQHYSAQRLHETIEFGKWLMAMQRKQPKLSKSAAHTWQPNAIPKSPKWLRQTLESKDPLPTVFHQRKQLASDFISATCKKQLRQLFDAGYIDAEEQPTRLFEGRKPTLWYLGKKGAQFLAQWHGLTTQQIKRKKAGSYSPALLQHRLDNNDIRISFMLAAERHGYQIRRWLDDDELRQIHSKPSERVQWRRPRNTSTGSSEWVEEEGTVVADHYLWLDTEKQWHNFIECDRGTKTGQYSASGHNDFARKIRAFSAYYRCGRYAYTYPDAGKSMRVLTITTSEPRLQNLKTITESVVTEMSSDERERQSGLKRYWFTTIDQLCPIWRDWYCETTILNAPVWWQAGQTKRQAAFW